MAKTTKNKKWSDEQKAFWEFRLHAENVLTNRTNYFLIAQSFFAMAAATLINTKSEVFSSHTAFTLIIWGGLFVSILWLSMFFKIYCRLGTLDKNVEVYFSEYKKVMEGNYFPYISSNVIVGFIIPLVFVIGWAISLFYYLDFYTIIHVLALLLVIYVLYLIYKINKM